MGPVVEILTKSLKMGARSCKKVVALAWDSQGGEGGWGRLQSPPWTPTPGFFAFSTPGQQPPDSLAL